jgi:hypothetical protein
MPGDGEGKKAKIDELKSGISKLLACSIDGSICSRV